MISIEPIKYPVAEQSFESIRKGSFLYVDKTLYIEKILNGSKYYFLSRPRRFGKSLFLSSLKCFFEGKRCLFKGLYIDDIKWEWETYPVLYLDFNNREYKSKEKLDSIINDFLEEEERKYGLNPGETDFSGRLSKLIQTASEAYRKKVVILIDEYDKPLINNIHDHNRFEFYRNVLRELYSNFKSSADYIRLVFLTGVSRFSKLSVLLGLNNIKDITLDNEFASICGITDEELRAYFKAGILTLATKYGTPYDVQLNMLKRYYSGYHFSDNCPNIYNTFSLLNVMEHKKYSNYWIESGTPTLLLEQLKKTEANLETLIDPICDETELAGLGIEGISLVTLFYQTGYLTIKDYDPLFRTYYLGMPNDEVTEGFFTFILPSYANLRNEDPRIIIGNMVKDLNNGEVNAFMARLTSLFSGISYEMKIESEREVQNLLLVVSQLIGLSVNVVYKRMLFQSIHITIQTEYYIYIIVVKYNCSATDALYQSIGKRYSLHLKTGDKRIIQIGINFSSTNRWLLDWKYQEA